MLSFKGSSFKFLQHCCLIKGIKYIRHKISGLGPCGRVSNQGLASTREVLLKGKAQYSWPPCINQFRSAPFILKILLTSSTKQATLMGRSTVLSLPLMLVYPASTLLPSYATTLKAKRWKTVQLNAVIEI